jgi:hypothetical protein
MDKYPGSAKLPARDERKYEKDFRNRVLDPDPYPDPHGSALI